jgi:hypothetical protein
MQQLTAMASTVAGGKTATGIYIVIRAPEIF